VAAQINANSQKLYYRTTFLLSELPKRRSGYAAGCGD